MKKLDKNRYYAKIVGISDAKFVQDGAMFDGDGNELVEKAEQEPEVEQVIEPEAPVVASEPEAPVADHEEEVVIDNAGNADNVDIDRLLAPDLRALCKTHGVNYLSKTQARAALKKKLGVE